MTLGSLLVKSRFRGCLLGHACGDALGAPVEFMAAEEIRRRYGVAGLEGMVVWVNDAGMKLPAGSVTDDTQMSTATARGLLDAFVRWGERGGLYVSSTVWDRYLEWLATQSDPRERRYPGSTCIGTLQAGAPGDLYDQVNDRKGSGGLMRVAPVGLAFPPEQAFERGAEIAALTHGHPSGYLAAGFLADVISRLVRGSRHGSREWTRMRGGTLPGSIAETREILLGYDDHDEVLEAVDSAVELYVAEADVADGISVLGEGWVAEEALGIALFAALSYPTEFREGVLSSVNITGDSDTTGCLTGALLGALLGESSIPAEWAQRVELGAELTALADELYDVFVASGPD